LKQFNMYLAERQAKRNLPEALQNKDLSSMPLQPPRKCATPCTAKPIGTDMPMDFANGKPMTVVENPYGGIVPKNNWCFSNTKSN
jgi:hypothetical protein